MTARLHSLPNATYVLGIRQLVCTNGGLGFRQGSMIPAHVADAVVMLRPVFTGQVIDGSCVHQKVAAPVWKVERWFVS